MAEVNQTSSVFLNTYNGVLSVFPSYLQDFVNIFLMVLLITIYAVLVWKFYRFIGRKNIIRLNLNKYNTSEHPFFTKMFAGFLYFIEYIIILPFLIFIWFAVFASFLILLSENLEIQTILFLSVTIIAAIRMVSYIPKNGNNIAQEIAKVIPYTLLGVFILDPNFFEFSRVLRHISTLPSLYTNILNYLSFIFLLEVILRFFDLIFTAFGLTDEEPEEQTNTKANTSQSVK